jgi:hypothetical protein
MIAALSYTSDLTQAQSETRPPGSEDGSLAWKFAEGDVIKMEMTQEVIVEMIANGQEMNQATETVNEMTMEVAAVDSEGVATVNNTISRMKTKSSAMGMEMEFDSDSSEELEGPSKMIGDMLRPMIGPTMTQKMSADGKVFDVEVPEEMMEGAKANPQMGAMFNKGTLEEMAKKAAVEFPESNPEIGYDWDVTAEIAMGPMVVATDTNYIYQGVAMIDGKPLHKIEADIKMSFPDGVMGGEVEIVNENSKAFFYFDGVAGQMSHSELDQDVEMVISVAGQEVEQHLKQKMKMVMTPVEK